VSGEMLVQTGTIWTPGLSLF